MKCKCGFCNVVCLMDSEINLHQKIQNTLYTFCQTPNPGEIWAVTRTRSINVTQLFQQGVVLRLCKFGCALIRPKVSED